MFVTSRLVVEDGNILPYRAVFVGPNRSFDEATNALFGRKRCTVTRRTVLHFIEGNGPDGYPSATPGDDLVRPQARSFEPADPPPPITDTAGRRYCIEEISISQ